MIAHHKKPLQVREDKPPSFTLLHCEALVTDSLTKVRYTVVLMFIATAGYNHSGFSKTPNKQYIDKNGSSQRRNAEKIQSQYKGRRNANSNKRTT